MRIIFEVAENYQGQIHIILDKKLRDPEIVLYTHVISWSGLSLNDVESLQIPAEISRTDQVIWDEPGWDPEVPVVSHVAV